MSNNLVYITGLPLGEDREQNRVNINRILQSAYKFKYRGSDVQLPRVVLSYLCGMSKEDILTEESEEMIKRCDFVVLLEGWNQYDKSLRVIDIASKNGLGVIYDKDVPYPKKICREDGTPIPREYVKNAKASKTEEKSKGQIERFGDLLVYKPTVSLANRWVCKKHTIPIWIDTNDHYIRIQNTTKSENDVEYDVFSVNVYTETEIEANTLPNPVSSYYWDNYESSKQKKIRKQDADSYYQDAREFHKTAMDALVEIQNFLERANQGGIVHQLYYGVNPSILSRSLSWQSDIVRTLMRLLKSLPKEEAIEFITTYGENSIKVRDVLEKLDLVDYSEEPDRHRDIDTDEDFDMYDDNDKLFDL